MGFLRVDHGNIVYKKPKIAVVDCNGSSSDQFQEPDHRNKEKSLKQIMFFVFLMRQPVIVWLIKSNLYDHVYGEESLYVESLSFNFNVLSSVHILIFHKELNRSCKQRSKD